MRTHKKGEGFEKCLLAEQGLGIGFYSQFCLFASPGTVTFGVTEQGLRDLQKQGWDWGP